MCLKSIKFTLFLIILLFVSCLGIPEGVKPVEDFDLNKYLGRWYEIARLDHPFERGLSKVYAEYSLREDGGIKVINRGYDINKKEWKEVEGRAYFVTDNNLGYLKVSFFRPFYSSYIVINLDKESYNYALVASSSKKYLWILSRTTTLDNNILEKLIKEAESLGFDVNKLIFVNHN